MAPETTTVSRLVTAAVGDDPASCRRLLPLLYGELHRLAHNKMAHEPAGLTLQTTALVHEAFLRLLAEGEVRWENRRFFFIAAAEAMRRILIERARRYACLKRGAGMRRAAMEFVDVPAPPEAPTDGIIALDGALRMLEHHDSETAEIVKLRYFADLTVDQTAELLGISPATVKRRWCFAQAWLRREITKRA